MKPTRNAVIVTYLSLFCLCLLMTSPASARRVRRATTIPEGNTLLPLKRPVASSATHEDPREERALEILRDTNIFGNASVLDAMTLSYRADHEDGNRSGNKLGDCTYIIISSDPFLGDDVSIKRVIKAHGKPDSDLDLSASGRLPPLTLNFWGSLCLVGDSRRRAVGWGIPTAWLTRGTYADLKHDAGFPDQVWTRREARPRNALVLNGNLANVMPLHSRDLRELVAEARDLTPTNAPVGTIVIANSSVKSVDVGIRKGRWGHDIVIPPKGEAHVDVPWGKYDLYFVFEDKRRILLQGDSVFLEGDPVGIDLKRHPKEKDGDYLLRRVKL